MEQGLDSDRKVEAVRLAVEEAFAVALCQGSQILVAVPVVVGWL